MTQALLAGQAAAQNQHGPFRPPRLDIQAYDPNDQRTIAEFFEDLDRAFRFYKYPIDSMLDAFHLYAGSYLTDLLKTHYNHVLPANLTYNDVKVILLNYDRPINDYIERYRFGQLKQNNGETFQAFAQRLKMAAKFCKFVNELALDQFLRSAFVSGIFDEQLRQEIFQKKPASFSLLLAQAMQYENAKTDAVDLLAKPTVNKIDQCRSSRTQNKRNSRSRHENGRTQRRSRNESERTQQRSRSRSRSVDRTSGSRQRGRTSVDRMGFAEKPHLVRDNRRGRSPTPYKFGSRSRSRSVDRTQHYGSRSRSRSVDRTRKSDDKKGACLRCGSFGHWANECKLSKSIKCFICQKTGHITRACKSQGREDKSRSRSRDRYQSNQVSETTQLNQVNSIDLAGKIRIDM
jgi:hypothetical protein